MRYISTRGGAPALDFQAVTLAGLASDGGLYVPEHVPALSAGEFRAMAGLDYVETAVRVMTPFVGDTIPQADLRALLTQAYASFDHPAVAPLKQLDGRTWLLELFHGPTLAFKDFALQVLGLLFERFLADADRPLTVVGATSGDTGSAAIHALAGRDKVRVVMLHPKGRVSEVQRRQMTTVQAANIRNVAVEGTFDDCQALVKAMFNDAPFRAAQNLSAVNSINWARLLVQVVYYVYAAVRLGAPDRAIAFAVPTGNFGDVFAGAQSRVLHWTQPSVGVRDERCVQIYKAFSVFEGAELDKTKTLRGTIIAITDHRHILWRWREARIDHVGKSCHECAHHVCVHISVESEQDDIARWLRIDWKALTPSHHIAVASLIHR